MDYTRPQKERPKVETITRTVEVPKEEEEILRELKTVQTKDNITHIYSLDEKGPGGARHKYKITSNDSDVCNIQFLCGPRNDPNRIPGILDRDLLEIVRDRLTDFQKGPYACTENQAALDGVCHALVALNKRVLDRIDRGVLGYEAP